MRSRGPFGLFDTPEAEERDPPLSHFALRVVTTGTRGNQGVKHVGSRL